MSADAEDVSPEALRKVLGAEAYAMCVQAALDAPPPSPAIVERIRLWAAPALREFAEQQRARARTTRSTGPRRAA